MFDIGFFELLLVGVVALLVLGPERLPLAARTCGLWLGRLRRTVGSIQNEINQELRMEELKRTSAIEKEQLERELREMRQPFMGSPFETGISGESDQAPDATPKRADAPARDDKEMP
ncbi:MAG: Sec-independent protein translocase protein TatB [Pseudomonadota bacterium]|jgi:sec-independent protein translocase protein TatB|nr:Sec-independent protein translocase protein TatB [Pseudomonadota bacterium]